MNNQIRLVLNEMRNAVAELNEIPIAAHVSDYSSDKDASPVNNTNNNVMNQNLHGDFLNLLEQALEDLNRPFPPVRVFKTFVLFITHVCSKCFLPPHAIDKEIREKGELCFYQQHLGTGTESSLLSLCLKRDTPACLLNYV
ncbi:hypothetical protein ILYODFUR_007150 [Ilyodon furcidens]|uniref:Uncharacterized protein n=1 Tax=Ilyodon furcidens TaxID=33524 RepID=A0ABV0U3C8_9TELE